MERHEISGSFRISLLSTEAVAEAKCLLNIKFLSNLVSQTHYGDSREWGGVTRDTTASRDMNLCMTCKYKRFLRFA